MIDFKDIKRVHFVGIGGVSMSKLCAFCLKRGILCSGSDCSDSETLNELAAMGANVYVGENPDIASLADIVVYTGAIKADNKELLAAKKCVERKYFLACCAKKCKQMVAVSGSHGKTTVTSMISWVLLGCKKHFVAHVGGNIVGLNIRDLDCGDDIFLTEACEYKRSFLELSADISLILNVDYDHPDCYASLEDTYIAFAEFLTKTKDICILDYNSLQLIANAEGINVMPKIITFGDNINSDYYISDIQSDKTVFTFDVCKNGKYFASFILNTANEINLKCALASIVALDILGVSVSDIASGLQTFRGVERRFECLGLLGGKVRVISDYAHHPTEIINAIKGGRRLEYNKVLAVFEPHTYSRTKALLQEFETCFNYADECILLPTYSARETPSMGATAFELFNKMLSNNTNVKYFSEKSEVEEYILKNYSDKDLVLLLGAGNFPLYAKKEWNFSK